MEVYSQGQEVGDELPYFFALVKGSKTPEKTNLNPQSVVNAVIPVPSVLTFRNLCARICNDSIILLKLSTTSLTE